MCGIAGRVNFRSGRPVDAQVIGRMNDLLVHRGPDAEGTFVERHVGLGNRRLAIIDLRPEGRMPMSTEDGRLWITHNGEVYNFADLRSELEARGHRFRSHTDTEVILASYREFGVDCLQRLRGMFAFAVWDADKQRLFVARDRLGAKPLFYYEDEDGLVFASESKAFLADPSFVPKPDAEAISHYLTLQYVPHPLSAFQGVKQLPPGHYLEIVDGTVVVRRYWSLSYRVKRELTEQQACEELLERLKEAVRIRLVSDVPIGAFLSGGIDSSTIVALMSELGAAPVKTFSIGFEEREYDELAYARLVAQRYETDHHEFIVRPEATEILEDLVWHYNEPFADSSAIPTYYLSRLTRQHVTVALNGDAGDENFAGYDRYVASALANRFALRALGPLLSAAAGLVPSSRTPRSVRTRARRFLEALAEPPERRYGRWMSHFHPSFKAELCTPEFLAQTHGVDSLDVLSRLFLASDAPDMVDATLDVDVNSYLPDDLLTKVDIASMAHSLEARSPMLDHEFMEFCASLPSHMKLRGRTTKYIFKRAFGHLLPAEVVKRPKMGFGVPLDHWFRNELRELTRETLLSTRALNRGYFRSGVVERLINEHVSGSRSWHSQLWNLLMLELWHQMFIDSRPTSHPGDSTRVHSRA